MIRKLQSTDTVMDDFVEVMRGVEEFAPTTSDGMENPIPAHTGALLRYELTQGEELFFDYTAEIERGKPRRFFFEPRILLRQLVSRKFRLQATYTERVLITNQSVQSLVKREGSVTLPIILGVLNSRLISWYFCQVNTVARRDDFPKTIIKTTRALPMPRGLKAASESSIGSQLSAGAQYMITLVEKCNVAKTTHERTALQRQIEATDRQIDRLVYELYGLTEAEIQIVEEATAPA
jgi:hypothetical protein